jgi:hypothetical protein
MKPIHDFNEQDGILINNEQESQAIRELLHGMGIEIIPYFGFFDWKPKNVPYVIYPKTKQCSTVEYAEQENITLHPASDYIIKAGDEVEVRDWEDETWWKRFYIGKNKKGDFITEDKDGYLESWNQIRKAPNPKAKAIAEIKKIAEENGINLKEI